MKLKQLTVVGLIASTLALSGWLWCHVHCGEET